MQRATFPRLMAFAMTVSLAGTAHCAKWSGGGSNAEYSTAANWKDKAVPDKKTTAVIANGDTVTRSVNSTASRTEVSGGATMNVTGGVHSDQLAGKTTYNLFGRKSAGTVNQSGGEYKIGHSVRLGIGANGAGAYYLSGGDLVIFRGSKCVLAPSRKSASLEVGDADATGLFEITGGALATRVGVIIGPLGTFNVVGSATSSIGIGTQGRLDGWWLQQSGGTLKAGIDATPKGVTAIVIDDIDDDGQGDVVFEAGSLLDVEFVGEANLGTFTVMTWDGTVTDQGLTFAPGVDTSVWSFTVNADSLTVTAQAPAPAGTLAEPE